MSKNKKIILASILGITVLTGINNYKNLKNNLIAESNQIKTLAFTIDGEKGSSFPNKEDGYIAKSVTCESGITAEWDNNSWGLINIVNNSNKKIKCSIDFRTATFADFLTTCDNAATCLAENASKNTEELAFDGTVDNNLRYIGANPNNYVSFNNELWRIIGVMNNVADNDGNKASRIKIIKADDLGKIAWDTANTNNWETSSLKTYLNGDYYNSLSSDAKSMISNITWNLGGRADYNAPASAFYTAERGTTVYSGRPTTGVGYIGLMYPSDYGFAVGESVRSTCLSTNLVYYNNSCKDYDWLYNSGKYPWNLTAFSNKKDTIFCVLGNGQLTDYSANTIIPRVFPVVYLNSDIKIKGGSGTSDNPFLLALEQ